MPVSTREPIVLSAENWWNEIQDAASARNWGNDLVGTLRSLISATLIMAITPEAKPELVKAMRAHLSAGISVGGKLYEVMVVIPEVPFAETKRRFFVLVPKYPGCKYMRLEELN